MRVAIIGGGTAGFMVAAHLTRHLPGAELLHVFDSRIPIIGVGEGTTPRFPGWFDEITGLGFRELADRCSATMKVGTRFEGWGRDDREFVNRFQPVRLQGYHFDAVQLVGLLAEHVSATRVDARVMTIERDVDGATLVLENGTRHPCDFVVDARGFPRSNVNEDPSRLDILQLDWIPTRAAIVGRGAPSESCGVTGAVARPHGWIFRLPLAHSTSCGYMYDPDISSESDVDADFDAYVADAGIDGFERRGRLRFPNFVRRDCFDGAVFRVGNAASFVEPLEATAIGTIVVQVRALARWIQAHEGGRAPADSDAVAGFNRFLVEYVCKNSMFIAWHYSCGSRYDTAFWRRARGWLDRAARDDTARAFLPDFGEFVEAGGALPGLDLPQVEEGAWDREVAPLLRLYRPFGNFSELNFAQVGHGIGAYGSEVAPRAAAGTTQRRQGRE